MKSGAVNPGAEHGEKIREKSTLRSVADTLQYMTLPIQYLLWVFSFASFYAVFAGRLAQLKIGLKSTNVESSHRISTLWISGVRKATKKGETISPNYLYDAICTFKYVIK